MFIRWVNNTCSNAGRDKSVMKVSKMVQDIKIGINVGIKTLSVDGFTSIPMVRVCHHCGVLGKPVPEVMHHNRTVLV